MTETALQTPEAVKGGRGAPAAGAEIALTPVVKALVRQAVPCSPWQLTVGLST